MRMLTADDPATHSADVLADNVERIRVLFPEAITEGKIDFEVLKQLLGGAVDEREERYGLNWHGKRRARQIALTPSTATLRPCPEESVDWETTQNLMIEGDNLEVLKLLQKSYAGKVKLITRNYRKEGAVPRSLLVDERFGRTRSGKTELAALMGVQVFDNPKPTRLLQHILSITTSSDDLVMDFFSGSGTTAHAAMAQSATDGGHRRYIFAQFPEPLDPENRDQKTAADFCDQLGKPRNIAELTKERLRRAGKKIKEENPLFAGDIGFRVFKLDTSNIRAWEPDRDSLDKTLLDNVEHIKPGRTEADVLYELLLKLGLDLCVPIETRTIAGKVVHATGAGTLLACLDERIVAGDVEPLGLGIAAWRNELDPAGDSLVVFRDSAFADDVAKTNLAAILQQHGIGNVQSL